MTVRLLLYCYLAFSLLFWGAIIWGIVRLPEVQRLAVEFYVAHGNDPWFVVLMFAVFMGMLNLRGLKRK